MIPGSSGYRAAQRADLLRFANRSRVEGGFGYLTDAGDVDPDQPMELYQVARMTHGLSLGVLAAETPSLMGPTLAEMAALAEHGIEALSTGPLLDIAGGWFASVGPGEAVDGSKKAYAHSFVVLAATSAVAAKVPGAAHLLEEALKVVEERFWDEDAQMMVDEWDQDFRTLSNYRGANANMHSVEAFLAAGDVTGDRKWHVRAGRITERIMGWARDREWRIPEHANAEYTPQPELHRDQPAHPFQPFGATVGHGMEWARLLIALDESLGADAPQGLADAAIALYGRAVADGWAVDGADGFVYTTDWDGTPVVRARMHWVVAEAICTATILHRVTGEGRYADDLKRWWNYADQYLVDHQRGSWYHELDPANRPAAETWSGKPDVYHAYQASLIADLPTTPSFASALVERSVQLSGPQG
ncbi:MAG: AGE family epimerase/isomerase [Arachnia sp.]